jgi:hypothetical protein
LRLGFGPHQVRQGFDGQFDHEKWLGNQIVAAREGGLGSAVEVVEAGDEDDGR